jgi:hypothetical protein
MTHEKTRLYTTVFKTGIELLMVATSRSIENGVAHCQTSKLKEIGNAPCHWYL